MTRPTFPSRVRAASGEDPETARKANSQVLEQFVRGEIDLNRLTGFLIPAPGIEFALLLTTGKTVVIFDTDFSGVDLSGLDSSQSMMTNNCTEIQFVRCTFVDARFVGSTIEEVTLFKDCDMTRATFENATMCEVIFDACAMTGVTFNGFRADRLEVTKTDVSGTVWKNASAITAVFKQVSGWHKTQHVNCTDLPPHVRAYIEAMSKYERYSEEADPGSTDG